MKIKIEHFFSFLSIIYFLIVSFPHIPTYNNMSIDSGIYAYIGQQVNKGKILYKEVWDYKFPAIYYIYAFLFKIFPDSRWTLYFTDVFIHVCMLILIFLILKIFEKRDYFWIISFLFTTTYRIYPCFSGGNLAEHFFLFISFISLYLLFKKPTKFFDFTLGNCFVWMLMFKQPYILIVLIIFLFFKDRILKGEKKFFFCGFLLSFLFFICVFLKGAPESFETVTFPFKVTKESNFITLNTLKNFLNNLEYKIRIILFVGPGKQVLLFLPIFFFVKDRLKFLFFSLFLSLLFIYLTTFALYAHYILLLNILILLGSIILIKNYPKKFALFFLILFTLWPLTLIKKRFIHSYNAFYKFFVLKDHRIRVYPIVFTVAKYIKPNETLFMIPDYCEVYFILKIESPWRFCGIGQGIPNYPKFKNELKKLIREKPPDYFYLEISIKEFENIFDLKPSEYKLTFLENNLYKFKILK
ncbi:MAG: hypothetical protein NC922_07430 [Candidatus Omnitrophica bacterium]|nr:hypothetical protein [Candidatus Omnitrophota bacterium]